MGRRTTLASAVIASIFLTAVWACGGTAATPIPAKSETGPTTTTPTAIAPGMVLLNITGSDAKQSQVFTAPRDWDIQWEVASGPDTGAGISVIIYGSTGEFVAQPVVAKLEPGGTKSDVYHVHRAGKFYLEISGLGGWHIKAVTV